MKAWHGYETALLFYFEVNFFCCMITRLASFLCEIYYQIILKYSGIIKKGAAVKNGSRKVLKNEKGGQSFDNATN